MREAVTRKKAGGSPEAAEGNQEARKDASSGVGGLWEGMEKDLGLASKKF